MELPAWSLSGDVGGPNDCIVGALLVGDAAGYYDPFTGQGVFRAR